MNQSTDIDKVAAAISAATGDVGVVAMTGFNREQNYAFASDEDLMRAVQPVLAKHGLAIIPTGMRRSLSAAGTTRSGTPITRCDLTVYYRVVHSSGQWLTVAGDGSGTDYGDKATFKAQTGAFKYLLRTLFCIPCGLDAERPAEGDAPAGAPARPPAPAPARGGAPAEGPGATATRKADSGRSAAPRPSALGVTKAPLGADPGAAPVTADPPMRAGAGAGDAARSPGELTDDELHELTDEQLRIELRNATTSKARPQYIAAIAGRLNARSKRAKDAAA